MNKWPNYDPLFYWVREREAIRIKKALGAPQPWSSDHILTDYRFCNVRREDDRGTVWIRENIREPFADHPSLWFMLCIARQINWPDTLRELMLTPMSWPYDNGFDPAGMTRALDAWAELGNKVYTGAYMISAPARKGASKNQYISEVVLGELWRRRDRFNALRWTRIADLHAWLTKFNGWGNFMAYQACVDMRFTRILYGASDIQRWAAAGPGTIRGLNRIYNRDVKCSISQEQARAEMRSIYIIVQDATNVALDFSDVPNILCEMDKYLRVLNGEGKPRALYVAGRGC